jgi:Hydrazine synthase alpha subunit middle domain
MHGVRVPFAGSDQLMTTTMLRRRARSVAALGGFVALCAAGALGYRPLSGRAQGNVVLPNPVMFVTQVPVPQDFTTIGSLFGNHMGSVGSAARGGDLWIRYGDGTLKNLTQAAGYGTTGFQGATSIAVREPNVHWGGAKAVFSMVMGGATQQYQVTTHYWQMYEITGLGPSDTPVITKVPGQPADYNNVSPIYGTDERIIFTSDRARNGQRHLSPQRDEYELAPVVTGLWSLNPTTGDLFLMQQSPSGSFSPQIDSFGRVVYIRWDHLQRDQQADADTVSNAGYGTFNYADESSNAARLNERTEVFPEPRGNRTDLLAGTNLEGHTFNDFFPWMINEDGTDEETLNHLGRHELHGYFNRSLKDDPNLVEFTSAMPRTNQNVINNFLHIREDPASPGTYFGIDAPEFSTHSAGQVVRLNAGRGVNPDNTVVTYVTHRDTSSYTATPTVNHSGLYRNPLPLSNGTVVAVHTAETRPDANTGTRANPGSRYDFRLKTLASASGGVFAASQSLTGGISKTVSWWDPDVMVSYSGPLWELDPVEVRARTRPTPSVPTLPSEVQQVFTQQGVAVATLRNFMKANGLALIVSNNVTTRDRSDRQQPFNLRVPGTSTQTIGAGGKIYDVSHMQLFQADQLRGWGGTSTPAAGRRVLARPMHDVPASIQPMAAGAPPSSVALAADGSMAAFVPARRAMSWQLTAPDGTPVVRERYWVTMQAGEVRVCTSCHGINTADQANQPAPHNPPQALVQLLARWRATSEAPKAPSGVRILRTN